VCRVCFVGALVVAGCAQAGVAGGDDGPRVGGNGPVDGSAAVHGSDMALMCGDHICSPSIGEACDNCPEDCGACPGCAPGRADCNHNPADGCETDITTIANCGACGRVCPQIGGVNTCASNGTVWFCKITCDANHADCNHNPYDGCEVDITTVNNCGGCGIVCNNPHGTTACSGHACVPSCANGWGACGPAGSGCTTNIGTSPDTCGGCNRPCSTVNVTTRQCAGGLCDSACAYPYSNCSQPAAPATDDGCETNGTLDPGEPDNVCSGQYSNTDEGSTTTLSTNRILPSGDADTFQVHLTEGTHSCVPLSGQSYDMRIDLVPPAGVALGLQYNLGGCDNTWSNNLGNSICVAWNGTCGVDDSRDYYFQVYGVAGANSCVDYRIVVTYASEGNKAPGCQ
jgi:hypothetical protein